MESRNASSIDVVYVLGKGSIWNNNEIRFSLRSIEKNLKGFRKIWVIGQKPDWMTGIEHIPFEDQLVHNADGNIARKVLRVCQEEDLTDNFLFINDDHLVMNAAEAIEIPPYHKGNMAEFSDEYFETDFWRGRLLRTKNVLISKGFTAYHYDCHVPMVINKKLFPEVMAQFNFEENIGYTMKSLYGNVVHGAAGTLLNGEKITVFRQMTLGQIRTRCANRKFVAYNNDGLKPTMKRWLIENFEMASGYEISTAAAEVFSS